jgi:hypothetical protein
MKKLEDFIQQNREAFDVDSPSEGHLERFLEKLEHEPVVRTIRPARRLFLSVAATILILMSVGAIGYEMVTHQLTGWFMNEAGQACISAELEDAIQYYDLKTSEQIAHLSSLTASDRELLQLSQPILDEIRNLDASTSEMKKQLQSDPCNEHIESAIVQNQQMKQSILNSVINRITEQQQSK